MLLIEEVELLAGTSSYDHRPFEVRLKAGKRTRRIGLIEDEDVTVEARIRLRRRNSPATDTTGKKIVLKVKYICNWRGRLQRTRRTQQVEVGKTFVMEERFLYDRGYLNGKVILNSAWRIKQ